ncbi:MAG TPA: hypothetical protein VEJ18_22055, partial [Planctomycetota bacterium]|nr:hypothetical protein [Planctomycetota bacterium]
MKLQPLLSRAWWAVLLFFLAAAAGAAAFLPRFAVDAGTGALLNEHDPDLAYYNITRADWAYDEYAIVCVRREDWFTPEGVETLKGLADGLSKVPHVKTVMSILDIPLLRN